MRRLALTVLAVICAIWLAALCLVVLVQEAHAADPRVCGQPARDAKGKIVRSEATVAEFKRIHPCPATGRATGACPGWAVDHVIPLFCGGADAVSNMQWLPNEIKSAKGKAAKDRWERQVYCGNREPASAASSINSCAAAR